MDKRASERPQVLLAWSSGKDSAWTLHKLRTQGTVDVVGLLTTINREAGRVAMHAVRMQLLEAMSDAIARARAEGITQIAFGDLFLEDVRRYRENQLAGTGIQPIFPLWGLDTASLARTVVAAGLRAYLTCVDPKQLTPSFVGRTFDAQFLDELPPGVDPCGERGEFHTFAYAGPMFAAPIPIVPGAVVSRDGFVFADLLLQESTP